jgi:hypothetical protein
MTTLNRVILCLALLACCTHALGQTSRYDELANLPFENGYPTKEGVETLKDELLFQRAVQSYIWALPALSMYAMKEGSEKVFGKGYNVLPIWKDRLNAKTLVTTPNSDVIYAMGYLDLKQDGPIVIEVPPGLQGILDDFFQRPICTVETIYERIWCGDVGLPGPDRGRGATCCPLTSKASRPGATSQCARAPTVCSCSGAAFSRIRSSSRNRSR